MRLSKEHIDIIKNTFLEVFGEGKIYLFGSRVDDDKRGGDIDLFIETNKFTTLQDEIKMLVLLEKRGIERKVDLVVKSPSKRDLKFYEDIKKSAIEL